MKRLAVYDFDGTLVDSPKPETGVKQWSDYYHEPYPYKAGWWSKPESLDLHVFNFNTFPIIVAKLRNDYSDDDTYVLILTARIEKLRPQVEAILKAKGIPYNALVMNSTGTINKGDVIMNYMQKFPDLEEIDVYDDMQDKLDKLEEYTQIRDQIPNNIDYKIYHVKDGQFFLVDESGQERLNKLISEEIIKFFRKYL